MMNRLKELRKERKLTLTQLGQKLGIPQNTLCQYETGKRQPRDRELWEKLADYFDVIPEYLLGYTTIKTKEEREMCEKCVDYWRNTKHLMESIRNKEE